MEDVRAVPVTEDAFVAALVEGISGDMVAPVDDKDFGVALGGKPLGHDCARESGTDDKPVEPQLFPPGGFRRGGYSTKTVLVDDAPWASITIRLRKPGPIGSQVSAPPKLVVPIGAPSTNHV